MRAYTGIMNKVRHAYDGKQALEIILQGEFEPDLLITDIDMKILNGYGLIEALSAYEKDIPVLVVSGTLSVKNKENDNKLKALKKLGIIGKIDKPVDFNCLFDKAQSVLLAQCTTE